MLLKNTNAPHSPTKRTGATRSITAPLLTTALTAWLAMAAAPSTAATTQTHTAHTAQTGAACLQAGTDAQQLACFKAWALTVSGEPTTVGAEPHSVRSEPHSVRAEPQSVRAEPVEVQRPQTNPSTSSGRTGLSVAATPTLVGADSAAMRDALTSAKAKPITDEAETHTNRAEPHPVSTEPRTNRAENHTNPAEPHRVSAEPHSDRAEPHSDRAEPQSVRAEPVEVPPTTCKSPNASALQRFWELSPQTDCDTFGLRGYKPLSLMWSTATDVNKRPSSPQVGHTASSPLAYQGYENLIQLSVRTKVAKGLLISDGARKDALWFGYTQKSFWQLFNDELSRPFRATDHEPEIMYIYPTHYDLGNGWNWRYAGLSLNHQSNGQTLPLSRSWNRAILMAGIDHANGSHIQAKLWRRQHERAANDDNPDIQRFMGRGEVAGVWALNPKTSIGLTMRHALRAGGKGAIQIDWYKQPSNTAQQLGTAAGMRYHVQLFSGYGDSLIDYNFKRTALRVGVSLVDW